MKFRLSFYFAAIFAVVGVLTPFWPVWLKSRGLDAAEIGLLLSLVAWARTASGPFIVQWADRRGLARPVMVILALVALGFYVGFMPSRGFWPLLLLAMGAGISFAAIMPLGENLVLRHSYDRQLDYGRLRLWGSLTFIAAAAGAGVLLQRSGEADVILWLVYGCLILSIIACIALPGRTGSRSRRRATTAGPSPLLRLLKTGLFRQFMLCGALLGASHGAFYGFASLYWRSAGISDSVIGLLWAEGVIAEILLFMLGKRLLARFGVINLLLAAALGGALRWFGMGLSNSLELSLLLQPLHALTFAAAHLGAMHFITRSVPEEIAASAQSLYAAAGGIAMGLSLGLAGMLYQYNGALAFAAMSLLSLAAAGAALRLRRGWSGGRLEDA